MVFFVFGNKCIIYYKNFYCTYFISFGLPSHRGGHKIIPITTNHVQGDMSNWFPETFNPSVCRFWEALGLKNNE